MPGRELALVAELQPGVGMSIPSYDWVRLARSAELAPARSMAGAVVCALVVAALALIVGG